MGAWHTIGETIANQTEVSYENYKKIKGFEDVGYFLISYVVSGGEVTKNITKNDTIDIADIVVSLGNDVMERPGTNFKSKIANTTYFLDFTKDGDWKWGTWHPSGTAGTDYLPIAEVTTDLHKNVLTITDKRGPTKGFRLKPDYMYPEIAAIATEAINARYPPSPLMGIKGDGSDDTVALQNIINYAWANGNNAVFLPSGTYSISSTITARGNILLFGQDSNNVSTTLKWIGSGNAPMLEISKQDGTITYKIVLEKITLNGGTGPKPKGIRLYNVSECEMRRVFVQNCTDAFWFDSAAIAFMDRIDTSGCDRVFTFETSSSSPTFSNTFITISRCNIWDTSYSVFNFVSGAASAIEVSDCWFENFGCFVKNEITGVQVSGFNHFNLTDSKLSNTSTSPFSNAKLFDIKAPANNSTSQFLNFSAVGVICEVNSSDYICKFDLNGNTGPSSAIGSNFSFDNCLLFGAPLGVVNSNTSQTIFGFKGSTIAQTKYYSGTTIPFVTGNARITNTPTFISYTPTWAASTTNPTLGNGTIVGRYAVRNNLVRVQLELTVGSTTNAGSGAYTFSLPFAHASSWGKCIGIAYIYKAGTMHYTGVAIIDPGASVINVALNNIASYVGSSNPITWGSADKLDIVIEYPIVFT